MSSVIGKRHRSLNFSKCHVVNAHVGSKFLAMNGSDSSSCPVATKREALQSISRIYDPLGFFSPVTLNGKLFIRELWKQEVDWDETLNESQQEEWDEKYDNLTPLYARKNSEPFESCKRAI